VLQLLMVVPMQLHVIIVQMLILMTALVLMQIAMQTVMETAWQGIVR
jgi:hypothetical protein